MQFRKSTKPSRCATLTFHQIATRKLTKMQIRMLTASFCIEVNCVFFIQGLRSCDFKILQRPSLLVYLNVPHLGCYQRRYWLKNRNPNRWAVIMPAVSGLKYSTPPVIADNRSTALEVKPNCCIREELTTNVIAATVPSSPRPSLHQFFCSLPELTDTNQQLYS